MKTYSALIIGSGAAGFSAADWLHKYGITDVAIVTEDVLAGTSRNTGSDKQTYYKLSFTQGETDSVTDFAKTLMDGGGMHGDTALIEAAESVRAFLRLVEYGVPFPQNEYGVFVGYQTDHDTKKRATSAGPLTSKMMTECLEREVRKKGIPILDGLRVVSLLKNESGVYGLIALDKNRMTASYCGLVTLYADNIILATGAPAAVYRDCVIPPSQTGSTGLAILAGLSLNNFAEWQYGIASLSFRWNLSGSYQQVIPRYVSVDETGKEREFLAAQFDSPADALHAVFLKGYQWPFDAQKREGSSRIDCMVHAEKHEKNRRVYLDFTKNPAGYSLDALGETARAYLQKSAATAETPFDRLAAMNPAAIDLFKEHGIDLSRDYLEISVSAQHNNGGILVDADYRTELPGLYAAGEAAGTFGLYRPGGSALNSGQVAGLRIAKAIAKEKRQAAVSPNGAEAETNALLGYIQTALADGTSNLAAARKEMSAAMSRDAGFLRRAERLAPLAEKIARTRKNLRAASAKELTDLFVVRDMLLAAEALTRAIMQTMEITGSRGGALYLKEGVAVREKPEYRAYHAVSTQNGTQFLPVRPVPNGEEWFETVWKKFKKTKEPQQP